MTTGTANSSFLNCTQNQGFGESADFTVKTWKQHSLLLKCKECRFQNALANTSIVSHIYRDCQSVFHQLQCDTKTESADIFSMMPWQIL